MTAVEAVQPRLTTITGDVMPLESLEVSGQIADSLGILELSQVFRNRELANIEAIYTFPLPFDGVLLGLQASIGGRVLEGSVLPRQQAEDDYEEAITDGDSAIMLEQQSPGLYTVNLGNLLPGEEAIISIRYALPLKWTTDQLRIALPLTVAPRYGVPEFWGEKPFAAPEHDFVIEYPLSVSLSITGKLASLPISSPTHRLTTRAADGVVEVGLQGGMDHPDRDLVVILEKTANSVNTFSAVQVGDRVSGHAVFVLPELPANRSLATSLLVDCSGSMAGASMGIARRAVDQLLRQSKKGDQLSFTAFGSSFTHYDNGRFQTCTNDGLPKKAADWLCGLSATLGGTEMESALRSVFSLSGSETPADVLMITDGEIWDIDGVIAASRSAGQRVFVIGVGLSPAESNLRGLAEATGGFVEFLSPAEPVEAVVARQLSRMRQPLIGKASFEGAGDLNWIVPNPATTPIYAGDTVHFWYEAQANASESSGNPSLKIFPSDCEPAVLHAQSDEEQFQQEIPRLAAAAYLKSWNLDSTDFSQQARCTELAVAHQLVTPLTNYLMVHRRGEGEVKSLPEIRQVKHMDRSTLMFSRQRFSAAPSVVRESQVCDYDMDYLEIPAFLRRQDENLMRDDAAPSEVNASSFACEDHSDLVNLYFEEYESLPLTMSAFKDACFSWEAAVTGILDELVSQSIPEECVLMAFWHAVLGTPFKRGLHRKVIWWIKNSRHLTDEESSLSRAMVSALGNSDKSCIRWASTDVSVFLPTLGRAALE